ncbi:2,5-diamino-6-(ribosylamino)-4(3H)-pyrimidinone 5'-phosphate reductase [Didymella keratinophila]|nr:2,5-diamino-6-(ribosylamino)-4(3H)-pyrimidinone 5'-phosphate reductase [Didymella keratinophila]
MPAPTRDVLTLAQSSISQISPYVPQPGVQHSNRPDGRPHVTLTFATSLDSNLSLAPGVQTALSGPQSKAMTHYLRSKHSAILVGVGTAIADNPSLNCRFEGVGGYGGEGLNGQPRPIVIDPQARWQWSAESKVIKLAREGKGRAPWVFTMVEVDEDRKRTLGSVGGEVIVAGAQPSPRMSWEYILDKLKRRNIESVMIEGGGAVINDLLAPNNVGFVDTVIVTIAPVWLGKGGVQVCPSEREEDGNKVPVARLKDAKWVPLGDDVVLCGNAP